MLRLSRWMAWAGGAMLIALVLMTCVSVLGRSLNGMLHGDWAEAYMPALAERLLAFGIGPVNGDFELIEAGIAFAIFAFIPLCQITGGHATVDLFANRLPERVQRWLQVVTDVVFAAVLILIAVQLFAGMQSKLRSGQTTFLIQFPLWWAYGISLLGAVMAAIVSVWIACARLVEILGGPSLLPANLEDEA